MPEHNHYLFEKVYLLVLDICNSERFTRQRTRTTNIGAQLKAPELKSIISQIVVQLHRILQSHRPANALNYIQLMQTTEDAFPSPEPVYIPLGPRNSPRCYQFTFVSSSTTLSPSPDTCNIAFTGRLREF